MTPFWKAAAISVGAYAGALALGFAIDFRMTLFLLLSLQFTWTLFCVVRTVQLRRSLDERDEYRFALGGGVSSLALFALLVVLTQAV